MLKNNGQLQTKITMILETLTKERYDRLSRNCVSPTLLTEII